ncbi:MAG: hypothetical protein ACM3NQ_15200, partial [Bacteroidales bacterium]
ERLLRVGTRLWREGRRDRDVDDSAAATERRVATWTPEAVMFSLERLVIRASLARRRAAWFTRLTDASVTWREPDDDRPRLVVIENGEIVLSAGADGDAAPPIPPGCARSIAARHHAFTLARFDRLRVLTTELKRLTSVGATAAVRFGTAPPLGGARLASVLGWL